MPPMSETYHSPHTFTLADTSGISSPILCIVVDTEEEFNWGGNFSRQNTKIEALASLVKAQDIFNRYKIIPTYAIDYPVATAPAIEDLLGPWVAAGQADIGAHLHPWVTPPFEEVVCPFNSFPCNLEPGLEFRKLTELTRAISKKFSKAPSVYKAGRYGYDIRRENMLIEHGFTIDASIMPLRSYSQSGGGPDFLDYPDQPFWSGPERKILHIPALHAPVGPLRRLARPSLGRHIFGNTARRLHIPGLLAGLGLVELLLLSPEGSSGSELYRMVKTLKGDGYKVFSLTFHSTSLAPGNTPYSSSAADVSAFLERLDRFFEVFMGQFGGQPKSCLEIVDLLTPRLGA